MIGLLLRWTAQARVLSSLRVEWVSSTWGTKKLIWYLVSLLHQKPWKSVTGWGEGRLNLLERHYCFCASGIIALKITIIWWKCLFFSAYFILRLVTSPTTGKGVFFRNIPLQYCNDTIILPQKRTGKEKEHNCILFFMLVSWWKAYN